MTWSDSFIDGKVPRLCSCTTEVFVHGLRQPLVIKPGRYLLRQPFSLFGQLLGCRLLQNDRLDAAVPV